MQHCCGVLNECRCLRKLCRSMHLCSTRYVLPVRSGMLSGDHAPPGVSAFSKKLAALAPVSFHALSRLHALPEPCVDTHLAAEVPRASCCKCDVNIGSILILLHVQSSHPGRDCGKKPLIHSQALAFMHVNTHVGVARAMTERHRRS